MSDTLQPCGVQHTRLPCPSPPTSGAYSNSCPSSQWFNPIETPLNLCHSSVLALEHLNQRRDSLFKTFPSFSVCQTPLYSIDAGLGTIWEFFPDHTSSLRYHDILSIPGDIFSTSLIIICSIFFFFLVYLFLIRIEFSVGQGPSLSFSSLCPQRIVLLGRYKISSQYWNKRIYGWMAKY